MRILITNNTLADRAGSELYARDLAMGLSQRGHTPIAYSPRLGDVATEIKTAGITVTDDLNTLSSSPDIIHGHHHLHTITALLRFPDTPAIYLCHGSTPWEEAGPRFPRILKYVAVDEACRDRLQIDDAILADRVTLLLNFVDLERFKPRAELPNKPQRALIFSNHATKSTHIEAVQSACDEAGIRLDVIGKGVDKIVAEPQLLLGNYDLIFAKGRAALEALAVGAAVVLCDATGAGSMVTTENVRQLRPLNFGLRALRETTTASVISREIARYDALDAERVSQIIRAVAGREEVVDKLIALYQEVIEEHRTMPHDCAAEQAAVATYLRWLSPRLAGFEALASSQLEAKENVLRMIKSSHGWRLISRYSAIKHKFFLPAYERVSGIFKRENHLP